MKTFTFVLALIFTMNISMASPDNGVKAILDDFSYTMTVDGAAADAVKSQETINEFRDRLLSLGVSRSEIIDTALSTIPDQRKATELKIALAHIEEQNLSEKDAMIVLDNVLSNGQQGASWDGIGETMRQFQIFGIVALVAVLLASVVNSTAGRTR